MGVHSFFCVFLFCVFIQKSHAHDDYVRVVAQAKPAVVIIETFRSKKKSKPNPAVEALGEGADFFEKRLSATPRKSRGSGFLLKASTSLTEYRSILTAAHVVRKSSKIKVLFSNGKRESAEILWIDNRNDIALLKVKSRKAPDYGLVLSDSKVKEGQSMLSIAGSFDLSVSSSLGIVSAVDVVLPNKKKLKLIQTDAAINPGSSGGPLLNSMGEVSGVISNIYSKTGTFSGTAFAVPSLKVVELIARKGRV